MTKTTLCARCGKKEVPIPASVEEDPICAECQLSVYPFTNDENGCPGWNDSCGNLLGEDADLCPDCTMGRMNHQSPRIGYPRDYC